MINNFQPFEKNVRKPQGFFGLTLLLELDTENFIQFAALDRVVFYVPANTVQVIWKTVFTGQKTQPTVSKY